MHDVTDKCIEVDRRTVDLELGRPPIELRSPHENLAADAVVRQRRVPTTEVASKGPNAQAGVRRQRSQREVSIIDCRRVLVLQRRGLFLIAASVELWRLAS